MQRVPQLFAALKSAIDRDRRPGRFILTGSANVLLLPQLAALRRRYPGVHFTGPMFGEELAAAYAGSDVLVFPSLTDTFGLVVLEALACGTPVAAFDVTGPRDILAGACGHVGAIGPDLRLAARAALDADRAACRAHAERFSWRACAQSFLTHLLPLGGHRP